MSAYDPITDPAGKRHIMLQAACTLDRIIATFGDATVPAAVLRAATLVLRDEISKSTPTEAA